MLVVGMHEQARRPRCVGMHEEARRHESATHRGGAPTVSASTIHASHVMPCHGIQSAAEHPSRQHPVRSRRRGRRTCQSLSRSASCITKTRYAPPPAPSAGRMRERGSLGSSRMEFISSFVNRTANPLRACISTHVREYQHTCTRARAHTRL